METERVDVVVVGAGFGGLAVASRCADAGLRVVVLERRPELAPEGVGLVLQPNGLAVLDRLGVVEDVLASGQRIDEARQCEPSGRVRAQAGYGELDHPHPYFVVSERTVAIRILADRLPAGADLRCGATVTDVERDGGRVSGVRYTDAQGEQHTLKADLVVGADGVRSAVRPATGAKVGLVTGPDPYVIGIAPVEPGADAALLYCGDGWCDGVMPLRGRTYFFDHVGPENEDAVKRRDFDAWQEIFARRVPEGQRIVASLSSFDDLGVLSGRTHVAAPRTAPGVALVGDAAAAVHPHNGQGANLALEDALALGDVLVRHGARDDAAIAAYGRARDRKARLQVPWSIFIGRTFDGTNAWWRAVRRNGYVMSRIPFVRRQTTARQAGLG